MAKCQRCGKEIDTNEYSPSFHLKKHIDKIFCGFDCCIKFQFPKIVTVIGWDTIVLDDKCEEYTKNGYIVLKSCIDYPYEYEHLQRRKIDISDEVFILNDYPQSLGISDDFGISDEVYENIDYAKEKGKTIIYSSKIYYS